MLVFVYGTLKRGGRLNSVLKNDRFVCQSKTATPSFDLNGGPGFPFMSMKDDGYHVAGELYDVSDRTLQHLDWIEGYQGPGRDNFYTRDTIQINTDEGEVEAFTYLCANQKENNTGITLEDNTKTWSPS